MNHRELKLVPAGARKALHCFAFALLPTLAPEGANVWGRARTPISSSVGSKPVPYLAVVGPPALRFQEALPPPDLSVRPPAGAPPMPALTREETAVALANADAAQSISSREAPDTRSPEPKEPSPTPPSTSSSPPPILPDDARPQVRPEDFLPFFQLPGTSSTFPSDVTVVVPAPRTPPAPASLPTSSATYIQK